MTTSFINYVVFYVVIYVVIYVVVFNINIIILLFGINTYFLLFVILYFTLSTSSGFSSCLLKNTSVFSGIYAAFINFISPETVEFP